MGIAHVKSTDDLTRIIERRNCKVVPRVVRCVALVPQVLVVSEIRIKHAHRMQSVIPFIRFKTTLEYKTAVNTFRGEIQALNICWIGAKMSLPHQS